MAGAVPDIPGVRAPPEGAREIMLEIMRLLGRHSPSFPGAQPVSFSRQHLEHALLDEDYFVCEKSDGLRCLMFLSSLDGEERVYLVTRKNEVFWIPDLHVPLTDSDPGSFHTQGTLIDGELVRTQDGRLKYLMFDLLAHNGKSLVERVLDSRLGYLKSGVFKPFQALVAKYPEDTQQFPFKIYMKGMELSYGLEKVLHARLTHLSDGLIFTSRRQPYIFGTDPHILKWKPPNENSVDFMLDLEFTECQDSEGKYYDYDSVPQCNLLAWHGGNNDKEFGHMYIENDEWEKLKGLGEPLNHRVVECIMDEQGRWRYLRFRDDKDHGNHIDTVNSVIESIRDHITESDLLESVQTIRDAWHDRQEQEPHAKRQKTS